MNTNSWLVEVGVYGCMGITDISPRLMLVDVWIPLYIAPKPKLNCWNYIRHFYASLVSCFLPHSSCHTDGNKKWSFLPFYWNGNVFFAVCNLLRIHSIYISEAFYQCFLFTRIVQSSNVGIAFPEAYSSYHHALFHHFEG